MIKLLKSLFGKLDVKLLGPIRDGLSKLNKGLDKFFSTSWLFQSAFAKIGTILIGFVTFFSSIVSILFAILNFGSLVDVVRGTVMGQSFWLEKLSNVIKGYPSFQGLVSSLDAQFASVGTFFQPVLTFTRIMQMFGIGDAVNAIVVCAVQGVAFVISMRLLFWSLGRLKLTMVKPIK